MHPYAIDEMLQERRAELHRQRHTGGGGPPARIPQWRNHVGRALASLAVAVAVPRSNRAATRSRVGAALAVCPPP